jgi:hypothetical protein
MNNIITQELKDEIDQVCKKYKIRNYSINSDGSIDVDGDVLFDAFLTLLPSMLKFNKVSGNFDCSGNELISLVGCPTEVGGDFYCTNNRLTSLEGCPITVGGGFYCDGNKLDSLEFCPIVVGGNFDCSYNELISLVGCPVSVGGIFWCINNRLTSLEHCPNEIGDFLDCKNNKLSEEVYSLFSNNSVLSREDQCIFIKYQHYFVVWTPEFDIDAFNDLIAEIKDGLE